MFTELDFLNRNAYRAYPIKQGAGRIAVSGTQLPDYLITSISLSIPQISGALTYSPFISQVYVNNGLLTVGISLYITTSSNTQTIGLGFFTATITDDFQSIYLTPYGNNPGADGFMTTGPAEMVLAQNGLYTFTDPTQTELEVFSFFIFPLPGVTSLNFRNESLAGQIKFGTLVNLNEINVGQQCQFTVVNTSEIVSLADIDSEFRNCPTPVITNINGMVPYPLDSFADDGNIYLFGVSPIVLEPDAANNTINVSTGSLTLNNICTLNGQVLPPTNPLYLVNRPSDAFVGIERYYSKSETPVTNFMTETYPEYIWWPNFATLFTLLQAAPTTTTYTVISPTAATGTLIRMSAFTDQGSVTYTVYINGVPVTGLVDLTTDQNGLVVIPTSLNSFSPSDVITVTITATSGSPNLFSLYLYYNQTPGSYIPSFDFSNYLNSGYLAMLSWP